MRIDRFKINFFGSRNKNRCVRSRANINFGTGTNRKFRAWFCFSLCSNFSSFWNTWSGCTVNPGAHMSTTLCVFCVYEENGVLTRRRFSKGKFSWFAQFSTLHSVQRTSHRKPSKTLRSTQNRWKVFGKFSVFPREIYHLKSGKLFQIASSVTKVNKKLKKSQFEHFSQIFPMWKEKKKINDLATLTNTLKCLRSQHQYT